MFFPFAQFYYHSSFFFLFYSFFLFLCSIVCWCCFDELSLSQQVYLILSIDRIRNTNYKKKRKKKENTTRCIIEKLFIEYEIKERWDHIHPILVFHIQIVWFVFFPFSVHKSVNVLRFSLFFMHNSSESFGLLWMCEYITGKK